MVLCEARTVMRKKRAVVRAFCQDQLVVDLNGILLGADLFFFLLSRFDWLASVYTTLLTSLNFLFPFYICTFFYFNYDNFVFYSKFFLPFILLLLCCMFACCWWSIVFVSLVCNSLQLDHFPFLLPYAAVALVGEFFLLALLFAAATRGSNSKSSCWSNWTRSCVM